MTVTSYERIPEIAEADHDSAIARGLEALWETKPGIVGWFSTVDHKKIGLRYIVTAFLFLLAGGVEALILRLQLARPELRLLTPEQYDQLFTMHGITMIFLVCLSRADRISASIFSHSCSARATWPFPGLMRSLIGFFSLPEFSSTQALRSEHPTLGGSTIRHIPRLPLIPA